VTVQLHGDDPEYIPGWNIAMQRHPSFHHRHWLCALQHVQNDAASLIFDLRSRDVVMPALIQLRNSQLNSMPHGMKNEMKTKIKQLKVKKMK
jgi:hypothetical protein